MSEKSKNQFGSAVDVGGNRSPLGLETLISNVVTLGGDLCLRGTQADPQNTNPRNLGYVSVSVVGTTPLTTIMEWTGELTSR